MEEVTYGYVSSNDTITIKNWHAPCDFITTPGIMVSDLGVGTCYSGISPESSTTYVAASTIPLGMATC